MKKFIFTIFIALFSSVAFAESSQEYGCRGVINTNLINGQQTGENQRFITALEHSKTYPRYLKCEADNSNDNNFCLSGTITINDNYDVYKCEGKKWIKTKVEDCPQTAEELIESGLKYNYQQAKRNSAKYVLFYNKRSDQHLEKHCHSKIDPFKKMEDECTKKNDLETGICHKLTTLSDTSNTTSKENTTNSSQSGSALSGSASASSQNIEQITMPGTPDKACGYSGGTYRNNQCICDPDKFLEEYKYEGKYSICRCMDGYHRVGEPDENGKYAATGKCVYAPEIKTQIKRDDMAMQRDAEDAYRNEYDNAQSWANKGTTALSTLMTGEGAMMAARAIAEKIADDDAEREMAEYVSTMKCEYGGGQSVKLGDTETLPGGNELANYYAEYKQLADKLKATKTALNLRPGIEAEVLYDRAETGLYQYQTAERQSGGFTSLSRALMNPEGADAEQWNAQRAETNRDLWVGGALATVGLAGSYIANRAINKDHKKEYKELEEKFREIKIQLEHEYPEIFIPTPEDPAVEEVEEVEEVEVEVEQEPTIEPSPQQPIPQPIPLDPLRVSSEAFKRGYASLTPRGRDGINRAIELITTALNDYDIASTSMDITAKGHSDPDGINPDYVRSITNNYKTALGNTTYFTPINKINTNKLLSEARAQVVVTALLDEIKNRLSPTRNPTYHVDGTDGKECKKPKTQYEQCRYVEIDIELTAIPKAK